MLLSDRAQDSMPLVRDRGGVGGAEEEVDGSMQIRMGVPDKEKGLAFM